MSHKIYSMKLHQVIVINMDYISESGYNSRRMEVMRVAGGWLYDVNSPSCRFVPYCNDMKDPMDGVEI